MSGAAATPSGAAGRGRSETAALIALALAILGLLIIAITLRGLWFLSLPLGAAALIVGAWSAGASPRVPYWSIAIVALVLGLLAVVVSVAALAASIDISSGYDVYEH